MLVRPRGRTYLDISSHFALLCCVRCSVDIVVSLRTFVVISCCACHVLSVVLLVRHYCRCSIHIIATR